MEPILDCVLINIDFVWDKWPIHNIPANAKAGSPNDSDDSDLTQYIHSGTVNALSHKQKECSTP